MTTAISPSRRASTTGLLTRFQNFATGGFGLEQRIAVIAQGATATTYSTDKRQIFSAQDAGETYGFGSPLHEIGLQLFPPSGKQVKLPVTFYPLVDGTTASDGDVAPSGTTTAAGTFFVRINQIDSASFQLPSGATVADAVAAIVLAVSSTTRHPMTAVDNASTSADFTSKWKGETANDLVISIEGPAIGMTFVVTQPVGGAGDPVIDATATGQFGDTHETMVINGLGDTTAALDALAAFGESRWDAEIVKPFVSFYASVESTLATAITIPDARKADRINSQLSAPGCPNVPWAIAARMVAKISEVANSASPASDYVRVSVDGLTPGLNSVQWTSAERDTAVKSGTSTSEVRDGLITISDTITMFHPTGDPTPAYLYVNNIVKLMNLQTDLLRVFDSNIWIGSPLIPNGQATNNRDAKTPDMAKSEVFKLIDDWGLRALISDPATAKTSVVTAIDGGNDRRLNIDLAVQLSGNVNITSIDLNFGFFFGA